MPHNLTKQPRRRHPQRSQYGLTLVELLVGIAIGLLLIVGATSLFLSNLDSSRRLLLEARLNQNLRSAAELITRDLRRASYWDQAVPKMGSVDNNPHQGITLDGTSDISYQFDAPAGAASAAGFALTDDYRIRMTIGQTTQDLTDPAVAKVISFNIIESKNKIDIGMQKIPAATPNTECLTERRYDITIEAEAPSDANVKRRLETAVRVRNDRVGNCS